MFTTLKAELLLHKVNARIDDYSAMVSSLEDLAGTIESACDRFDFDCDVESDYHVASRISFYTQHIMKNVQDFQGMCEWYERRIEIEERKRAKLRDFLKANADDYFDAAANATAATPDYDAQTWAIDFDIHHADSDLTSDELADYEIKLREALTTNGNTGVVAYEACYITVYGNGGGDNKQLVELLKEMYKHGCWCEVRDEENDELIQILSFGLNELVGLTAE